MNAEAVEDKASAIRLIPIFLGEQAAANQTMIATTNSLVAIAPIVQVLTAGTVTAEPPGVMVRIAGLALTVAYASFIVWLYSAQPKTVAEVTGGLSSSVGAYHIDAQAMGDGLAFFRRDAFDEARFAFERADPAHRDARTQFYIAYSYYRQGWGRIYNDDVLFRKGLEAVDLAIALAPDHRLIVDDPDLGMHSGDELKAELQRGITRDASDLNPLNVFRARK